MAKANSRRVMEMPRMQYFTVSEKGIHASPAVDSSFTGAG